MSITSKLTEQVCLQRVSHFLLDQEWEEWFMNPTAGPWKKLRIRGIPELENLLRFGREEDRPDLIVARREASTILICEAKDDLSSLLSGTGKAVKKSVEVFETTASRLFNLIAKFQKELAQFKKPAFYAGYIFPEAGSDQVKRLNAYHQKSRASTKYVGSNVNFVVHRKANDDLIVKLDFGSDCDETPRKLLKEDSS